MSVVAVVSAGGSSASTTTSMLLASMAPEGHATLLAECDPSGGDVATWAQLMASPGWATAVANPERSWRAISENTQTLPSGRPLMSAPVRASEARPVVVEAARGFGDLLSSIPDVVTIADCGTIVAEPPIWVAKASLTLVLLRQGTATATVARVERAREALDVLRPATRRIGVVLIGSRPYPVKEIETALGIPLFGQLEEDRVGAEMVAGAWTVGKRASKTPLARSAKQLAARVIENVHSLSAAESAAFASNGGVS